MRRAATTCSEEMTSCDHVDSWRNTLLRRPSSSAGQAGSAAWPQIARIGRQERPARRQTDECTTHDQFGAITRSRRGSGGLWCGLYSGQKAQQPAFMLKIDDTSLFNAGAVMGHGAPSLWHWFQAMYHLWGKCQCRHPALYYNYPLFTRLMHLLGA